MTHSKVAVVALGLLAFFGSATSAAFGQDARTDTSMAVSVQPCIELFAGPLVARTRVDDSITRGWAEGEGQTLTLRSGIGAGLELGANIFPFSRFGIQARFARFRGVVASSSTPYQTVQRAYPLTDSTGTWSWTAFSVGPAVRGPIGRRARYTAALTVGTASMGGDFGSVGRWTDGMVEPGKAWLVSGVISSRDAWDGRDALAVAASGELSLVLTNRVALSGGLVYMHGTPGQGNWGAINPQGVKLDPSHVRTVIGFHVTAWRWKRKSVIEGWREK